MHCKVEHSLDKISLQTVVMVTLIRLPVLFQYHNSMIIIHLKGYLVLRLISYTCNIA